MNQVHERIRSRLEATGKTLRQASLASRLSPEALSKLLNKPLQSQTIETIKKLAIGLETSPEWLAFGMGREQHVEKPSEINGPSTDACAALSSSQTRDNARMILSVGDLRTALSRVLQLHGLGVEEEAASLATLLEVLESRQEAFALVHLRELRRNAAESPGPTSVAGS